MHFADQCAVLAYFRWLLGRGESGHPHLLAILPDFKHWCLSLCRNSEYFWSNCFYNKYVPAYPQPQFFYNKHALDYPQPMFLQQTSPRLSLSVCLQQTSPSLSPTTVFLQQTCPCLSPTTVFYNKHALDYPNQCFYNKHALDYH